MDNRLLEELALEGYRYVACLDEVGRGCLFGSVMAACVILPVDHGILGLRDSKKLSYKKREALFPEIVEKVYALGFGVVDEKKIDEINIKQAARLAMKLAVQNLRDKEGNLVWPDYLLTDAEPVAVAIKQQNLIKGDDLVTGIAAASILAKVMRDRLCLLWDKWYPEYGIAKHKGYPTKQHREALLRCGTTDMHRQTFLKNIFPQITNKKIGHNINIGRQGENKAISFLEEKGLILLTRNYNCPYGEIDIIMKQNNTTVFVEVKTRYTSTYGSGSESINYNKQQKIVRTANYYLGEQGNFSCDARFDFVGISSKGIEWTKDIITIDLDMLKV